MAVIPVQRYDRPSGRFGHRFVHALAAELIGFRLRLWNTERIIVFQTVIFQRNRHMTKSGVIRRQINQQMDAWEVREHEILAEDTERTCAHYLYTSRGEDSPEHHAKIYHSLVLCGKLHSEIIWITDRDKGGVVRPGEISPKTDQPVLEVLRSKHPEYRPPMASNLEAYGGKPPVLVPVGITDETVATIARKFSGAPEPGISESVSLQKWLLRFGAASMDLR